MIETDTFRTISRGLEPSDSCSRQYTCYDHLRLMNDSAKRAELENFRLAIRSGGLTPKRVYAEAKQWEDLIPTVFIDPILENTQYRSVSGNIAASLSVDTGLTFKYREFEHFQRAQRGAETTEFLRHKGSRRLQEVDFHTLGVRSYVTEEEALDIPFSAMQLELNGMGAAMALERDLLWVDSLFAATDGQNATDFNNHLTATALDRETLLAIITWFFQPFAKTLDNITLTNPFDTTREAKDVEHKMRLGLFRPSDVVLSNALYFDLINDDFLQQQNIWQNSKILDTGALQVPLMGVNLW